VKFLRNLLDSQHKNFQPGGKLEKFYVLYEMVDTFAFTPGEVATGDTHVRDALDFKRLMITVAIAVFPCILMAMYNTGLQGNLALESLGLNTLEGWRGTIFTFLGGAVDSKSCWSNLFHGAMYFVPIYLVTNAAGGLWEVLFAGVRGHEINEGFLVTGVLFPLIVPASIPLWQVALGISFGVVFGKEIYGGTGKNFLNPALTARAFLFFAYPAQISGDAVWTSVDGFTGATALGQAAAGGLGAITTNWADAFWGFMPGSMGETSAFACLIGAIILVATGVGSWRIIVSSFAGLIGFSLLLNLIGSSTNPMFAITPLWHIVLGGFAFGAVFMATDPGSSTQTLKGQYFYGVLIGFMVVLIRVINPAFPEGTMLAILFANVCAPLIDYFVVNANIKRRRLRNA
jgi:Na+-transporting NADH:ubiquinone oxidoreductase subunit B